MIIYPGVSGAVIGGVIIAVPRAVPLIGAAPGNHLDLRAARGVKVIRLTEGADFEFLDALDRGGHDTRSYSVGLAARETCKVIDVTDGVPGHIIRVVPTIYCESVLVHVAAGYIASWRDAWL